MAGSTYEITIKTTAQLAAAQATKKALEDAIKVTKELGKDSSALEKQLQAVNRALTSQSANAVRAASSLESAIKATKASGGSTAAMQAQLNSLRAEHGLKAPSRLQRGLGGLAEATAGVPVLGRASTMLGTLATTGGGVVAGIAGGLGLAAKGVSEYAQAEKQVAKLDAALAQAGQLTDGYREKLQALAGQLQETSGVADDEWLGVLAKLTQFGANESNIEQYSKAVMDLAGLMGGDVQGAAMLFSRAMQGSTQMLSRYGIKVTEGASTTQKLNEVMEQAARRGAGQLEAQSKTLSGQWQRLKNSVSDLFEAFGRWISRTGMLQSVLYGLGKSASFLAEVLGGTIPKVEGLANAQQKTIQTGEDAAASADAHADAAERVADAAKAAKEALEDELKALKELHDFEDKQADAEMALALAKLEARTDLTKAQKIEAEHNIREQARVRKVEREVEQGRSEVEVKERVARQAESEAGDASLRVLEARANAGNFANMEALKAEREAATKEVHSAEEMLHESQFFETQKERDTARAGAQARLDKALARQKAASLAIANPGTSPLAQEGVKRFEDEAARKQAAAEAARKLANDARDAQSISEARIRAVSGVTGQAGVVSSLTSRVSAYKESLEAAPGGRVTDAAARMNQGNADNYMMVVRLLNELGTADGARLEQLIAILRQLLAKQQRYDRALELEYRRAANSRTQ